MAPRSRGCALHEETRATGNPPPVGSFLTLLDDPASTPSIDYKRLWEEEGGAVGRLPRDGAGGRYFFTLPSLSLFPSFSLSLFLSFSLFLFFSFSLFLSLSLFLFPPSFIQRLCSV